MPATGLLLTEADGPAVAIENASGQGGFVLVCEHASNRIPEKLGTLDCSPETLTSHAAWDPGALALARRLSTMLDSPLVFQRFSRLVYDCNRPPESPGAMPVRSEVHDIAGNCGLTPEQRAVRTDALYRPFVAAVSDVLDSLIRAGSAPLLVTLHTFTPVWFGNRRDVAIGLLHDEDARLALAVREALRGSRFDVRINEPYGPQDGVTHTLQLQALPRGIDNLMIEVRNDLVADEAGVELLAETLGPALGSAAIAVRHPGHARRAANA